MKKPEETLITEEGFELRFRPRASSEVTVQIPDDALTSLREIAASRDMSVEALIKLYIGQGLRQDSAKQLGDSVLEKAAVA